MTVEKEEATVEKWEGGKVDSTLRTRKQDGKAIDATQSNAYARRQGRLLSAREIARKWYEVRM
jgi:hypothetical protein